MIEEIYKGLKFEAENFHVNKFFESQKISDAYKRSIEIILSPSSKLGVVAFDTKYGQGKTFFFRLLSGYMRRVHSLNIYREISAKELVDAYKKGGEEELSKVVTSVRNLLVDDLGEELGEGSANSYGNKLNVLKYVILKRYELWEAKGFKLHATTNLTIEQIAEAYGGRAADRLSQITEFIPFDFSSNSFRQVKSLRPLTEVEKKANLEKLKKPEVIESIDMVKYLNELLSEGVGYIERQDIYFFNFIKTFLVREGKIRVTADPTIDELALAEWQARQSIKNSIRTMYRHNALLRNKKKDEALSALNKKEKTKVWNLIEVKKLLISMRDNDKTF